jgi:acyl-CoA synthetase (AMP-forming)/AMP-acid ligase II
MERIHHLLDYWKQEAPDTKAFIDSNGKGYSYADLYIAVDDAELILRENAVSGGDRVMIIAENSVAEISFLLAASRLDAWAVLINARMTASEIEKITSHSEPKVLLFTSGVSEAAKNHGLNRGALNKAGSFGEIMICANGSSGTAETVEASAFDQVAVMLYTTGTTGSPKGVMLTHDNLIFAAQISSELRDLKPGDHLLLILPITHVFGLASVTLAALNAGTTVELMATFAPAPIFEALSTRVTSFPAVPQMHALLMKYAREQGIEKLHAPKLRYVSSGGAPLDPDWKASVEAFLGQPLFNGYGLTETTAGIAATKPGSALDDVSVGGALPGQELKLIPPPGQEGLKDGVGEILIRGRNVMKGYYRNPEETAKALDQDGWFHSGDLGSIDGHGNLTIVGRCKELIIRSGFNVYPPEVEAAINDHSDVVQSAVIGRQEPGGNEEILAFVEVLAGSSVSPETLLGSVRQNLTGYKCPSRLFIVDKLPAATTGKILKYKVLDTFADLL